MISLGNLLCGVFLELLVFLNSLETFWQRAGKIFVALTASFAQKYSFAGLRMLMKSGWPLLAGTSYSKVKLLLRSSLLSLSKILSSISCYGGCVANLLD